MSDKYIFCESVTATGISPWCVRNFTEAGPKAGGGVDTDSLCGRVQSPKGWDIPVASVSLTHPKLCAKCKAIIERQGDE